MRPAIKKILAEHESKIVDRFNEISNHYHNQNSEYLKKRYFGLIKVNLYLAEVLNDSKNPILIDTLIRIEAARRFITSLRKKRSKKV